MNQKRFLITALVAGTLIALVCWQVHSWRKFDWSVFFSQTAHTDWKLVAAAVALIYSDYVLRAWRWKIFLKPVKATTTLKLTAPQLIGFTGLALLGRAGEFIRPYLIAKKEQLTFSSQMAVWTVERIFDLAAITTLLVVSDLLFASSLRTLPYFTQFQTIGIPFLIALVVGLSVFAFLLRRNSGSIAAWVERFFGFAPGFGSSLANKVRSFGDGLHTIHDGYSFLALTLLSLVIWLVVALAYLMVTHSYPGPLGQMTLSHVLLLMGFSVAGGVVQLPVVGGGSQMMTILALAHVFSIPKELAVSCGILLWLATFVSVTPAGLILAHFEHISFRELSRESHQTPAVE
jgi:uncharacterized protein (TIRG00374 family)